MRAVVSGATGFVGRKLLGQLAHPVVLTRDPARAATSLGSVEAYAWDPVGGLAPVEALRGADTVFHLAGDPIAEGRWTEAKKRAILDSRVLGTRNLVEALSKLLPEQRPQVLVSVSAVGFYGDRGDELLEEDAAAGSDFLADVCRQWEEASQAAMMLGIRVVNPRLGIVLGRGGALEKMLLPFKLGLGGRLGSGRQWMPWIHIDDVVGMLLHAVERSEIVGPMNTTAPNPATNRQFTATLASVLHRPAVLPVPKLGLKLAMGDFGQVLTSSQRTVPGVALRTGYDFKYPELREALEQILAEN